MAFRDDYKIYGMEYAAERSARLGFDSVEFLDGCPSASPLYESIDAGYAERVLAQNGLTVACCSLGADLLTSDTDKLKEQLARQIEFAARVKSPYLHHTLALSLSVGADAPSYQSVLDRVLEKVIWIAERCAEYGMTCLYEPQGMYFNGVEGLRRLYRCVREHCENVGICGDVGNSLFVDVSANDVFDTFADSIRHVHVKDYGIGDRPSEKEMFWKSRGGKYMFDREMGQGVTDFAYCFAKLKQIGYRSAVSFEISGDDQYLTRAIDFIKTFL